MFTMDSLRRLWTLLQDPVLVAKFQHYFGIRSTSDSRSSITASPSNIVSRPISAVGSACNRDRSESAQLTYRCPGAGATDCLTSARVPPPSAAPHTACLSPLSSGDGSSNSLYSVETASHPTKACCVDDETAAGSSKLSLIGDFLFQPIVAECTDSVAQCDSDSEGVSFVATQPLWHLIFVIGSALGDEVFYASFLPLWFWNIDGAVGRRTVLVWLATMYIGQAMKDVLQIPRPSCPPVIRVAKKWALEYGFPSTHSMVAVSLPGALLAFTHGRYEYPMLLGFVFAIVWCLCICCSRVYLGMHSILDVLAGLVFGTLILAALIPFADVIDDFLLRHSYAPLAFSTFIVSLIVLYPSSPTWNPTKGDTVIICAVVLGFYCGSWLNYHQRLISAPSAPPPYAIIWPTYTMIGKALSRSLLGLCTVVATRAVFNTASSVIIRALLTIARRIRPPPPRSQPISVDICCKFVTYVAMGIDIVYTAPLVFRLIDIGRPEYYTEV